MKFFLLFLFVTLSPVFIFMADVLYFGVSPTTVKSELNKTNLYEQTSNFFTSLDEKPANEEFAQEEFGNLFYGKFTPDYIQDKTEKLIDDSDSWIKKDGPPPVLSFADVKEDLVSIDPEFQAAINELATNPELASRGDELMVETETSSAANNEFEVLAKSDFSIPLGKYFEGVKVAYGAMKIVHPILGIVLILLLLLLMKVNDSWPRRALWVGSALLTSAIVGFGLTVVNDFSVTQLVKLSLTNSADAITIFAPILLQIAQVFMKSYARLQSSVSMYMGAAGLTLIIFAIVSQKQIDGSHQTSSSNTKPTS